MEMIRTFRIVATDKETFEQRDYKYTESYQVSGNIATVSYYDDEFTSLSTDTIDLDTFDVRAMPNKTSRKGVYYKARPLPSIASLAPIVAVFKYIPVTIPVRIPTEQIEIPQPIISITKAGYKSIGISVPAVNIPVPAVAIAKEA